MNSMNSLRAQHKGFADTIEEKEMEQDYFNILFYTNFSLVLIIVFSINFSFLLLKFASSLNF